ncbi:hypothetical protein BDN71DRAFT_1377636, partial [Pleurotus eryngii]
LLPYAAAAPLEDLFPDIRFVDFAKVVNLTFGENITLATVLMLLFSITSNTDILNLHGQQRAVGSNNQVVTSWMAAFVRAIKDKLQTIFDTFFLSGDNHKLCTVKSQTTILGKKLDSLCQFLDLYTHNDKRQLCHKLLPISTSSIQPIIIITPPVMGCSSAGCHGHGLTQYLCDHDISKVTLLCGSECFEKVSVLAGRCPKCSTMFWADHESFIDNNRQLALYLPNAKYLKVGKQVWVDHIVSKAIVNANYSFHASTAAITEFWNYLFVQPSGASFTLTCRQVWKAFVVESICLLAGFSNSTMIFMDNLKISELVTAAYLDLGDGGIICSAVGHSFDECCHAFKDVADVIPNQDDDPAALAGHDENHDVLEYAGPAVAAAVADAEAMDVDNVLADGAPELAGGVALHTNADVRMIVIDGILEHDNLEEQEVEEVSGTKYNNYFSAPRFYCVETICAPCGVVIAWCKFAKAEGVAKILRFLEDVYENPNSRPSYIAIDKGCALLKHIVKQHHWPAWEPTTRIIVDSYHYINHQVTDYLCRTWCNPAPLNGAAPNLVVVDEDK